MRPLFQFSLGQKDITSTICLVEYELWIIRFFCMCESEMMKIVFNVQQCEKSS